MKIKKTKIDQNAKLHTNRFLCLHFSRIKRSNFRRFAWNTWRKPSIWLNPNWLFRLVGMQRIVSKSCTKRTKLTTVSSTSAFRIQVHAHWTTPIGTKKQRIGSSTMMWWNTWMSTTTTAHKRRNISYLNAEQIVMSPKLF